MSKWSGYISHLLSNLKPAGPQDLYEMNSMRPIYKQFVEKEEGLWLQRLDEIMKEAVTYFWVKAVITEFRDYNKRAWVPG
jgi:hypothetical protein